MRYEIKSPNDFTISKSLSTFILRNTLRLKEKILASIK